MTIKITVPPISHKEIDDIIFHYNAMKPPQFRAFREPHLPGRRVQDRPPGGKHCPSKTQQSVYESIRVRKTA